MPDTDRLFYGFMLIMSLCILGLLISLIGCTGPIQSRPFARVFCDPLSVTISERSKDPCELEHWENQRFAKEGLGG
jgi:hypothetical protein